VRKLSLRARLLLGVFALSAIGLVAADVATYSSLSSYLVGQVDGTLNQVHVGIESAVFGGQGGPPEQVPGDCVELRRIGGGATDPSCFRAFPGQAEQPAPKLPAHISLPSGPNTSGGDRVRFLTVPAISEDGYYRVRASEEAQHPGYVLLIAQPLGAVDSTLHRLLLIELLVTGIVLAALAGLAFWIIRIGLHPLRAIEETAATIAAGDLSQRVERAEPRTEVGRLGLSLNAMLGQIESAFKAREESEAGLRRSEQKLRRFVADASHELRTPLAAVRAYAELFGRGASARPDDLARSMTGISREAERMSMLVEDLLLLARLDEGRPLEQEPVDLAEIVGEAVDAARVLDPARPIGVSVEPAVVIGDRTRLRQVIDNLFANVRAHTPPESAVAVSLQRRDGNVELRVADHGPGLSEEQVAQVFERFFRADSSRTRASGGVGLGLSIVAGVAQAHGGSAAFEPTPGGGATFVVTLPLA
jgi:two-component system OmpR family sensor kinase